MTNQDIIDLAAQFDLITFGPQDLVFFAREIESRAASAEREACIKACDSVDLIGADECIEAIRARGSNEAK